MRTLTKFAVALTLPLVSLSAASAPTGESVRALPNVSSMRYQARNHKTLFNSERNTKIDAINKAMVAKKQGPKAKLASVTPDFSIPASDQYDYIDGPNGSVYLCSAEFETEDVVMSEYYTRKDITAYKFTVYDTDFNVVGEIKGKVHLDSVSVPENPETRVASMGLTPIITKKFFNSDEKFEVMVYFNMNTEYNVVNSRSIAYQLGGAKDEEGYDVPLCTIQGNLCDVLEAPSSKWSEDHYLSFATDYEFPTEEGDESFSAYVNSMGVMIETFKKAGYGSTEPVKIFEYKMRLNDWPGDQESASPFFSKNINGKPYIIINGYTDGLWLFEEPTEDSFGEQIWNENTNFFVDIYQPESLENPNLIQHTEIEMTKSPGDNIFATFYYLGDLSYRDDVNFEYCDEAGKANLVISKKDWEGAEMGTTTDYLLYTPEGELMMTLGEDIEGVVSMSDIEGQEPQFMFVKLVDGEYVFEFINPYNGTTHNTFSQVLPWDGELEGMYVNVDRVADGDSYKYCFELMTPGLDDQNNDLMRIAWVNTDGEIKSVDEVNMGKNIRMAKVYIDNQVLNPYTFDTTPEREYMIIVKRGDAYSTVTHEEFLISAAATEEKPIGKILMEITPDDERGSLVQVAALNPETDPLLWVMYYNLDTEKYSQEFFRLPLTKFAGGEGTPENPYQIATVGDLQCIRDNLAANYAIVSDFDAAGYNFSPVGSSTMPFTGTLKGNGHTIKNLTVNGKEYYSGLFSYMDNATVSGITFLNPTVVLAGNPYNGLVAGGMQRSTLTDVHAIGLNVDSNKEGSFGGLVNWATLNSAISGCSVSNACINLPNASVVGGVVAETRTGSTIAATSFGGELTAKSAVGGILGASGPKSGGLTDCHVNADIAGEYVVGGIVGDMDERIIVDHCHVQGTLAASTTYGTKILNKGYAVGGIAGSISNLYLNNESSGSESEGNPVSHDVVTNCFVNLESITTPELPEGHQNSVHRIAGFTSINNLEPDWDNITDYDNIDKFLPTEPELGLKNNYAVVSLAKIDEGIEAGTNTTEGMDIAKDDLNGEFFAGLGFKYGSTAEMPWQELPEDSPMLYHEFGSKFLLDEIIAVKNTSFEAELLVISRQPLTEEAFIDGFACEVSDESVVEMNGELALANNVATIGFNAKELGEAEFTANVNGTLAKVKFHVVKSFSGVADAVAAENTLKINFDGTVVSAENAALEVYNVEGRKVAAGRNALSVEALANGIYIVVAKDAQGNHATKKFILQ